MSRDTVHRCPGHGSRFGLGLVVPGWVELKFAEQFAGVGQDADVQVLDQDEDASAGVSPADSDVVQAAVVPHRHDAGAVEPVLTDAVVAGVDRDAGRDGAGAGGERFGGGAAGEGAVGADGVVVGDEDVELALQRRQRPRRGRVTRCFLSV